MHGRKTKRRSSLLGKVLYQRQAGLGMLGSLRRNGGESNGRCEDRIWRRN